MKKIGTIGFALACAAVITTGSANAQQVQQSATYLIPPVSRGTEWNRQLYGPGYSDGYSLANQEHRGYPSGPRYGGGGYRRARGVPPPYVQFNRRRNHALPHAIGIGAAVLGGAMMGGSVAHRRYATHGGYNYGPQVVRRPSPGRNADGCFGSDRLGPDGECNHVTHGGPQGPGPAMGPPRAGGMDDIPPASNNGHDVMGDAFAEACVEQGMTPDGYGNGVMCAP